VKLIQNLTIGQVDDVPLVAQSRRYGEMLTLGEKMSFEMERSQNITGTDALEFAMLNGRKPSEQCLVFFPG